MSPRERSGVDHPSEIVASGNSTVKPETRELDIETTDPQIGLLPLDVADYNVNRTRAIIQRLELISQNKLPKSELANALQQIKEYEVERLRDGYLLDFATELDPETLQAAGYELEVLDERLSPQQIVDYFQRAHEAGADVTVIQQLNRLAIKQPLAETELDALASPGDILDLGLNESPWERRVALDSAIEKGEKPEFDRRGRMILRPKQ